MKAKAALNTLLEAVEALPENDLREHHKIELEFGTDNEVPEKNGTS